MSDYRESSNRAKAEADTKKATQPEGQVEDNCGGL